MTTTPKAKTYTTELVATITEKYLAGTTLAAASTLDADLRKSLKTGADTSAASAVGKLIAERADKAGVKDVVFDRGSFLYHGRVKALADAAREGGLKF